MPQDIYTRHRIAVKQQVIDDGYVKTMQELINTVVSDDGRLYFGMFQWVNTHLHIDTFENS
jgi:hypothetical protein